MRARPALFGPSTCRAVVLIILLIIPIAARAQFSLIFPRYPTDPINDICFVDSSNGYFCNAGGSIFRTSDGGETWLLNGHNQGDPTTLIRFLDPTLGLGASPFSGLGYDKANSVVSANDWSWWTPSSLYLADATDFLPVSRSVILKADDLGISRLDNYFGQWTRTYKLPMYFDYDIYVPYGNVHRIVMKRGGDILALASYWRIRYAGLLADSVSLLLRSTDSGKTWAKFWQGGRTDFRTIAFASDDVGWMGGEHETILKTTDGGSSWIQQHADTLSTLNIRSLAAIDSNRAVAIRGWGEIIRTTDGGATWTETYVEQNPTQTGVLAFPTPSSGFFGGKYLCRTRDGGAHWEPVNNSIDANTYHIQFINRTRGWVSTDRGLYRSTDGGVSWSLCNDYTGNSRVMQFEFRDSLNGWGEASDVLLKTTDGGVTWTEKPFDPPLEFNGSVTFWNDQLGVACDARDYAYQIWFLVTSDGGVTWEKRRFTEREFLSTVYRTKFTDPGHLWFSCQQGMWLSQDTARTWKLVDSLGFSYYGFDMTASGKGFVNTSASEFDYTSDGGATWSKVEKPYNDHIRDIAIIDPRATGIPQAFLAGYYGTLMTNEYGFGTRALTTYTMDWFPNISVVRTGNIADVWVLGSTFQVLHADFTITGVDQQTPAVPVSAELFQNYPNPFNPTTKIEFSIQNSEFLTLKVYDLLGREVAVLVKGQMDPGAHQIRFDGSGLASGIYVYRLSAGNLVQSKKMLLLK
jgi:photosystem II stability/assembly factor-like uncharacterized protein